LVKKRHWHFALAWLIGSAKKKRIRNRAWRIGENPGFCNETGVFVAGGKYVREKLCYNPEVFEGTSYQFDDKPARTPHPTAGAGSPFPMRAGMKG
jgi:hypothetical protein